MTVLGVVEDPDGRRIELTVERWEHIVDARTGHPELVDHQDAILRAVAAPDAIRPGRLAKSVGASSAALALPVGCRWS